MDMNYWLALLAVDMIFSGPSKIFDDEHDDDGASFWGIPGPLLGWVFWWERTRILDSRLREKISSPLRYYCVPNELLEWVEERCSFRASQRGGWKEIDFDRIWCYDPRPFRRPQRRCRCFYCSQDRPSSMSSE